MTRKGTRMMPGEAGYGKGAGHFEKERESYHGCLTNSLGCCICCVTCCPCGFLVPMDSRQKQVWVVDAPAQQHMAAAGKQPGRPGLVSARCGGACGRVMQVQG